MLYRQVKIDVTHHCDKQWLSDNCITMVQDVYLYKPEEKTHCCEIRPSYELIPVRTEIDVELDDFVDGPEYTYMHCSAIDRMKTTELGFFSFDEDAIEEANANWID